jgi:hypothetical protein
VTHPRARLRVVFHRRSDLAVGRRAAARLGSVTLGNLHGAPLRDEHAAPPLWRFRLVALGRLGYVPLLVARWLA